MTATIWETERGYEEDILNPGRYVRRTYHIKGAADDADARAVAVANVPYTDNGLPIQSLIPRSLGRGEYRIEANYSSPGRGGGSVVDAVGETTTDYSVTAETEKIYNSLSTVNTYVAAGVTAADYDGALNVQDGKVEGLDIVVPRGRFSEKHLVAASTANAAFWAGLETYVGVVNSAAFRSRSAGEVIFLGAEGRQLDDDTYEVIYQFGTSPNASGVQIGSITGVAKDGWDYLWIEFNETEDGSANKVVRTPAVIRVERVYARANLATALGI